MTTFPRILPVAGTVNLNVHFHTLVPDGVFDLLDPGPARFVRLPFATDEELTVILTRFMRRAARRSPDSTTTLGIGAAARHHPCGA
jgi:hypothetical protein